MPPREHPEPVEGLSLSEDGVRGVSPLPFVLSLSKDERSYPPCPGLSGATLNITLNGTQ